MKLWHLQEGDFNETIEMGPVAILCGHHSLWFKMLRNIDDYFNARSSTVTLMEDTVNLTKSDWECHLLSYDIDLNIKKITAKSPLNIVLNQLTEQLSQSPLFYELVDAWEALQEELELINPQIEHYELAATLDDFTLEMIKKQLTLQSVYLISTPIEEKIRMLKLIATENMTKKKLILIEFPELYADEVELRKLYFMIQELEQKGFVFIVVTLHPIFEGNKNYLINDKVINASIIASLERELAAEVPFGFEKWMFVIAQKEFLKVVDNYVFSRALPAIDQELEQSVQVLIIMIGKSLGVSLDIDIMQFPENIQWFLKDYLN